ncbi:hypothetical protein GCM10010911_34270 [Paenibacillus nasutitermitis]|uniref:Uncharacterized protein n=1 Tax=Paenibacillus nasutitermitis TaxID=1652958 RepID=A0A916Z2F9_9BACL|nr:hypothetical protein GCM10010911_34270 [Paenibacillus nasutitermitis]
MIVRKFRRFHGFFLTDAHDSDNCTVLFLTDAKPAREFPFTGIGHLLMLISGERGGENE